MNHSSCCSSSCCTNMGNAGAQTPNFQNYSPSQLMTLIYQTGFALDDILLYLDTHPCDSDALNYYQYVKNIYNQAVNVYTVQCGPLRKDQVKPGNYWDWITETWPWEGGNN